MSRQGSRVSPADTNSERSTLPMGDMGDDGSSPEVEYVEPTREELLEHFFERFKFYTSLCLGTSAILAGFAFLFLIPFVVEPSIQTILAEFASDPGTCAVSDYSYAESLTNCSWASCREGCTTAHTRCHKISVNLARVPYRENARAPPDWDEMDLHFLINPEGCGYPPNVNCSEFAKKYIGKGAPKLFPCYYSTVRPELVVERYSWEATVRGLALALSLPPAIFAFSIAVLAYWHCRCCERACKRRVHTDTYPTKEGKLLCDLDDEGSDDVF